MLFSYLGLMINYFKWIEIPRSTDHEIVGMDITQYIFAAFGFRFIIGCTVDHVKRKLLQHRIVEIQKHLILQIHLKHDTLN